MDIIINVKKFISSLPNQSDNHKNILDELTILENRIKILIQFSKQIYVDNNNLKNQQESNYIKLKNLNNLIDILRSNNKIYDDLEDNSPFDPSNLV
jgi:hypothetical protein